MNTHVRVPPAKYSDQLRIALLQAPTCRGYREIGDAFCPISPENRDKLVQRLTYDDQNMVCEGCGSTKPMAYYKSIGAMSCCPERKMVAASDVIAELDKLRKILTGEGPDTIADDFLYGAPAIAAFLGDSWTERAARHARDKGSLPIRQRGKGGILYAFKSELRAALKDPVTLPK